MARALLRRRGARKICDYTGHDYWGKQFTWDNATHFYECIKCGTKIDEEPHSLSNYPSFYVSDGHYYTCTKNGCGYSEMDSHTMSDWSSDDEETHSRYCMIYGCGYEERKDHDWNCEPNGNDREYHKYSCTDCELNKLERHLYGITVYDNESHEYMCSECGFSYLEQHDWVESGGQDPTCTEDGCVDYTCTICGGRKSEPISALGHEMAGEYHAPTCTEGGYRYEICQRDGCDYEINEEYEPLGHDWGEPFLDEIVGNVWYRQCQRDGCNAEEQVDAP